MSSNSTILVVGAAALGVGLLFLSGKSDASSQDVADKPPPMTGSPLEMAAQALATNDPAELERTASTLAAHGHLTVAEELRKASRIIQGLR